MAEVEETLKRLQSQKGVQGIIVVNTEGIPIKSTMDNPTTTQYANLMHNFILKARSTVREIDPQNDLTFLRIRSKKNEIMVAPGLKKLFLYEKEYIVLSPAHAANYPLWIAILAHQ
ncbi:Dynlrb1 [Phodopus roborovskii]|uniref:Dynlrb1 protein n=1 Tax=Phodopus roborovskii TaxID=109678 RepID=A0AAU9YRF0_PHORO|nr:Dynlrb1 [Phodopus roborovskii]